MEKLSHNATKERFVPLWILKTKLLYQHVQPFIPHIFPRASIVLGIVIQGWRCIVPDFKTLVKGRKVNTLSWDYFLIGVLHRGQAMLTGPIYICLVMLGKVSGEAEGMSRSLPDLQLGKGHPRQRKHLQRHRAQRYSSAGLMGVGWGSAEWW